jgi:putative endonuclease
VDQWFVYALRSLKDGQLYIGISQNPERRLLLHNKGVTKSTRQRRPFELIFQEACGTGEQAREREKYYKSGIGRETIRKLIPR